jgi:nucleoid-associated protein YgaU
VALFSLDPSDDPRVMTLGVTAPDGTRLQSQETVVIGPIAAPALVAEAAPDPETQPDTAAAEGGSDAGPATAEAPAAADEPSAQVAAAEPAAPEVLIIDNAGVRRQSGAGSVTEIVIDTIGYGATGEVEIAGRGIAGQFARLYLDNADITVVGIGEDGGWGVVLTDVEPGLYTLRVDQTDGTGKVTSRFETPFQREAPDTVIAALQQPQPETKDTATEPAAAATAPSSADAGAESAAAPATAAPEGTAAPEPDTAPNTASGIVPEPVTAGETTAVAAPAPETTPSPATRAAIVTVQPGFTLWRIARENYGDGFLYVKVFEANKDLIRDPDLIYPGQIFSIPDPAE